MASVPKRIIQTARLYLRPASPADFDAAKTWAGDAETTYYMLCGCCSDEKIRAFLGMAEEEWSKPDRTEHESVIALTPGGAAIGACDFCRIGADRGEMGWILHPAYQHRGYVTEAARAMMRVGFEECGVSGIIAQCDTENAPSYRVMERLGMTRVSETADVRPFHGILHDEYIYEITRDEFFHTDKCLPKYCGGIRKYS